VIVIEEQVIEIPSQDASLHGVLHLPCQGQDRALVFCHPFAEEKKCAHRTFVEAARACAEVGWAVLRFDLRGCGDSPGSFAQYDLDDWCEDIANAADYVRQATGNEHVGLLGLRPGEDFEAASADSDASGGTDLDGYWVSARVQEQLKAIDLLDQPAHYLGPVLVLNLTAGQQLAEELQGLAAHYARAQAVAVRQEPFWQRIGIIDPGPTVRATVQWLQQL